MKTKYCFIVVAITILFLTSCKKDILNELPVADAGNPQTVQLPVDSVGLTGSGTDSDGQVVAYSWTEVVGPNTAVIAKNGSASTTVKGLIAGKYIFQLMVVDNSGAVGADTVTVTVNPAIKSTLALQPNTNPTEVHIYGNGGDREGSTPYAPEIGAAAWSDGGSMVGMRALLKFDLSTIPSNAKMLSAKLTLFSNPTPLNGDHISANAGPNNSMFIERVTSSWSPGAIRWTNQPSVTANNRVSIPHTSQGFLDLVDIDVTQLVGDMVTLTSNNGFLIRLQTESAFNSRIFCSSKYPDASKHPKLIVEYN